jgi:uncharacterized protein (TIGR02145 family)
MMKTIFKTTILLLLLVSSGVYGQRGIGTNTPDPAAILELASTSKGFLPPRMSTTERNGINSGVWAEGLIIYNTDTKCLELYNGTDWISLCDGSVVTTPSLTTQVASNNSGGTYTFLNHNLGADTSLDPHTPVVGLQGAYIQWGKRGPNTTGDSTLDWQTAANNGSNGFAAAPTSSNSNSGSISGWSGTSATAGSWNIDENNPVKVTANDPCPTGYRVPTRNEWVAVDTYNVDHRTGTFTDSATNYGVALHYGPDASTKLLTLPTTGYHLYTGGALFNRGNVGRYWSSTESGSIARSFYFNSSNVDPAGNDSRTNGFSVRCIAE